MNFICLYWWKAEGRMYHFVDLFSMDICSFASRSRSCTRYIYLGNSHIYAGLCMCLCVCVHCAQV